MFVLDSSSAVSDMNFKALLKLITEIMDQFEIGVSATQVGLISFDSRVSTASMFGFEIGSFTTKQELKQYILSLQQLGDSGRNTHLALALARQQLMSFRSDASNAVIVITSGISENPQITSKNAEELQMVMNTEVFVIGTSSVQDSTEDFQQEIFSISETPDNDHVFMIHTFSEQSINSVFQSISRELCDGKLAACLYRIIM